MMNGIWMFPTTKMKINELMNMLITLTHHICMAIYDMVLCKYEQFYVWRTQDPHERKCKNLNTTVANRF